ncbi:MAG: hypothetical protein GOU98_03105 [Candidatus Altiarchaeota archaeon]|nr:hypothetical protein [Candidatus Altiarchaeota archaeon]
MIDFLLIAVLGALFGVHFSFHYLIIAAAGLLVGFFFGGLMFFLKILPVLFISFIVPLVYAISSANSLNFMGIAITAAALTVGYSAGAALAVVVLPFRIAGKIMGFFWKIIKH